MKAYLLNKAGGIENFVLTETDRPSPQEGEILIESKALAINPLDVKIKFAEEGLSSLCGPERPVILGWDVAGTVVEVGENANQFKPGDKVFGMVNFPGPGKCYAELVAAPEAQLALIPDGTSFEEAAATTLAAMTALQSVQTRVKAGDRVLIQAASGGVGHFAVQIAKEMGAYVAATSSGKNRDFVMALGADEHVDYREQKFEEVLSDIDFVLDSIGGEVFMNSLKVLKDGGGIVCLPMHEFPEEAQTIATKRNLKMEDMRVQSNVDDINTLKAMLQARSVKPHVSKTFSFADLSKSHTYLEAGRTVGKVVITF